jgi:hypothetical protein
MPTPTSNDLARPGMTGATRLVPSESRMEGKYSERTWFMETSPSDRRSDINASLEAGDLAGPARAIAILG